MKLSALVLEAIATEIAKQLAGGMTEDKREVQRLRDFWVEVRAATWYVVEARGMQPARHCRICDAWEVTGCKPGCVFERFPREGK